MIEFRRQFVSNTQWSYVYKSDNIETAPYQHFSESTLMARTLEERNRTQPRNLVSSHVRDTEDLQIRPPHSGAELESTPTRMLRLSQVIQRTGLGKTKIYELQNAGLFPMKVHVTPTAVRWIEGEIEAWLTAHPRARVIRSEL